MMKVDLHVHSNNSCDAQATVDQMCEGAIARGLSVVCFTEHIDMNPKDEGYCCFHYDKYNADIERARDRFGRQLEILKGVEFSEPHVYPREFETVTREDYDFVLGSVHWVDQFGAYWADESRLLPGFPFERLFNAYYSEVLKAVRFGGFDSLAHIDFPKRYMLRKHEPDGILRDILSELVRKGIALELNSQPVRKGYGEINPSAHICELLSGLGGTKVTTGSDAHNPEDVGKDFETLESAIGTYGFKPVYFVRRKAVTPGASNKNDGLRRIE
jgi:histidinol-phosphatase (PHP family)